MIKQIVFDPGSHFERLRRRSFTALVFFPMDDDIQGEPLVTLALTRGLAPVRDFYARMESEPGEGGGTAYRVRLRVRFESGIRRKGRLKGRLGVNIYVEGATDYFPFPPGG